jgi:hypothetical protein
MSSFHYEKELGLGEFRLLRLLKGAQDPIQCELLTSKLASPEDIQDYAALSYTWGIGITPCDIIMNATKKEVTINLYLALRDLRLQEEDRILWIDALCIDQSNEKEKSYQVQQMGSIFSNAIQVNIWLGQGTYETDYFMNNVQAIEKKGPKCSIKTQLLAEGLQQLLRRDWFKRVWIIQETANARVADIV